MLSKVVLNELGPVTRQATIFYNNKGIRPLPKTLDGKMAYLRGYLKAVRMLKKLDSTPEGMSLYIQQLKQDCPNMFFKRYR